MTYVVAAFINEKIIIHDGSNNNFDIPLINQKDPATTYIHIGAGTGITKYKIIIDTNPSTANIPYRNENIRFFVSSLGAFLPGFLSLLVRTNF